MDSRGHLGRLVAVLPISPQKEPGGFYGALAPHPSTSIKEGSRELGAAGSRCSIVLETPGLGMREKERRGRFSHLKTI